MAPMEEMYSGFSCPAEKLNERFVDLLTTEYAREYVSRFIGKFEGHLSRNGSGATSVLTRWAEGEADFRTVWDPAFGGIRKAVLFDQQEDAARRAASLILRLHQGGCPGDWELTLGTPVRLNWGRWLLPPADRIAVSCRADSAVVRLRHGAAAAEAKFWRSSDRWCADGAEPLPVIGGDGGDRLVLMTRQALEPSNSEEIGHLVMETGLDSAVTSIQAALSVLAEYAPEYLTWVDRVLRYVIPLRGVNSMIRSGSSYDQPGLVQMTVEAKPVAIAEMLVHESSHQYYQILCRLGAVDDGSDSRLYYSPVKQTGRPISYILLAYHAFSNVLLFYRKCHDADTGYCQENEAAVRSQLLQLEPALRDTPSLTPIGRALWEPLSSRIQ